MVTKEGDIEIYGFHDTPKASLWSPRGDLVIGTGLTLKMLPGFAETGPPRDPWDAREASNVQAPAMHTRQPSEESQNTLRRRGEEYLARTAGGYDRARSGHKTHHAYEHDDR